LCSARRLSGVWSVGAARDPPVAPCCGEERESDEDAGFEPLEGPVAVGRLVGDQEAEHLRRLVEARLAGPPAWGTSWPGWGAAGGRPTFGQYWCRNAESWAELGTCPELVTRWLDSVHELAGPDPCASSVMAEPLGRDAELHRLRRTRVQQ